MRFIPRETGIKELSINLCFVIKVAMNKESLKNSKPLLRPRQVKQLQDKDGI
jgi:hypothetical protein